MYSSPVEHLRAERQRFDLILLTHMRTLRPVGETAEREHERVMALLGASFDQKPTAWGQVEDLDAMLRRLAETIRAELRDSVSRGRELPLVQLCRALDLDSNALGLLMLACLPHFDRKYARVLAYLQGSQDATLPRVALALELFGDDERTSLRPHLASTSALMRCGHVSLGEGATQLDRPICVTPRLIRLLEGRDEPDAVVSAMRPVEPLPSVTRSLRSAFACFLRVWRTDERPGALGLVRSDEREGLFVEARRVAAERRVPVVCADLARPSARRFPVQERVRELFREARLLGGLLCLTGYQQLSESERELATQETAAELELHEGACLIEGVNIESLPRETRRRSVVELLIEPPGARERGELWSRELTALGEREHFEETALETLGCRYQLTAAEIRDIARMAVSDAQCRGDGDWSARLGSSLERACAARCRHGLSAFAQLLRTRARWTDLILPDASLLQLDELVRHLRHHELVFERWGLGTKVLHSAGVTALFSGPPGTGKTMASALIAGALGRELYRVDLAGIVSKYIGETEKNLDRVFRAAERSNIVLFFDEADALFGKRTEIKDAHDRYANVETSYLLQKLEGFDGIVILATNYKKNVDPAFMRRLSVVVDFPVPGFASRLRLWTTLLPEAMPRDDSLDLEFLARRFELSGGHIKNAIQTAALLAADSSPQIVRFEHLLFGVRRELQKLGRVFDAVDFGRYRERFERVDAQLRGALLRASA